MKRLPFRLDGTCLGSSARAATITTLHGPAKTPLFMPVGTRATVKGVPFDVLEAAGAAILLANTYHLLLRPGPDFFEKFGGIHQFTGWQKAVLTDSGGYQIFSLPNTEVTDHGAMFRHPLTGDFIQLTPEKSIAMQRAIQSDIMMALDECVPADANYEIAKHAVQRTHAWAERSLAARGDAPAALFGIVQGACHTELREQSAAQISAMPFDGFAIGGLAVGESKQAREKYCALTAALLPTDRPRYLMGVGTPLDLLEAVHRGVDMFDCIIPTERAQQGFAFTFKGKVRVTRTRHADTDRPLAIGCKCATCRRHSIAYLHHLFKSNEPLGPLLLSIHNLWFYGELMSQMRRAILNNTFAEFYAAQREQLDKTDGTGPQPSSKRRRSKRTKPTALGAFCLNKSQTGHTSIRHIESGEVMHSVTPPDQEAEQLYVQQSKLSSLLQTEGDPITIWDVGLGAAHNAMAAIRTTASLSGCCRSLHIVSFEKDLDALRLALSNIDKFPHLRHPGPGVLLKNQLWTDDRNKIEWTLIEGDFLGAIKTASAPDIIFFDPFSAKTDTSLWTFSCFKRIREACGDKSTTLITYANATSVRAALLAAGFFVAKGETSGPKESTTLATTLPPKEHHQTDWLDTRWLGRFKRSSNPFPQGVTDTEMTAIQSAVISHPQFNF